MWKVLVSSYSYDLDAGHMLLSIFYKYTTYRHPALFSQSDELYSMEIRPVEAEICNIFKVSQRSHGKKCSPIFCSYLRIYWMDFLQTKFIWKSKEVSI